MPSIWLIFDHVLEVFEGIFFAFLLATRRAGDKVVSVGKTLFWVGVFEWGVSMGHYFG